MIAPPPEKKKKKKSKVDLLEIKIRTLEARLKTSHREQKILKSKNIRLNNEVKDCHQKIEDLKPKASTYDLMKIETRIKQIKGKLSQKTQENQRLREKVEDFESEISLLSKALNEKYGDNDVSSILYSLSKYKTLNQDLIEQVGSKTQKIEEMEKSLFEKNFTLDNIQKQNEGLIESQESMKEMSEQYQEENNELKHEIKILIDKVQEVNKEKENFDKMKIQLGKYERLRIEHRNLKNERNNLADENETFRIKLNKTESDLRGTIPKLKKYEKKLSMLKAENHKIRSEMEKKVKQLDQFARINNELRLSSEKAKRDLTIVFKRMKKLNLRNTHLVTQINDSKMKEKDILQTFRKNLDEKEQSCLILEKSHRDLVEENEKILDVNEELRTKLEMLACEKEDQKGQLEELEQSKSVMQLTLLDHLKDQRSKCRNYETENKDLKKRQDEIIEEYKKLQILYEANSAIIQRNSIRRTVKGDGHEERELEGKGEENNENTIAKTNTLLSENSKYDVLFDGDGNLMVESKRKNVLLQSLE